MKNLLPSIIILIVPVLVDASELHESPNTQTLVWPDGTRYVGGVSEGKRSGKGTIFWQDGTRFIGQFENDLRNGPGTMILPDGTIYTGFFENDELLQREDELSIKQGIQPFNEAETKAALANTDLPMEADSLFASPPSEIIKNSVQYETVEINKSASGQTSAEITAGSIDTDSSPNRQAKSPKSSSPNNLDLVADSVEQELIKIIDLWAAAWSDQNVAGYLSNYSEDFKVPNKQSRRSWEKTRQERLTKPRYIILNINYKDFRLRDNNVVEVFFQQTYKSNTYSDLTDKVLRMRKEDLGWKILYERSR